MKAIATEVIRALEGQTLAAAESLTGGMIGSVLTSVPGASAVFKGGVISYVNQVKEEILGVPAEVLGQYGAVSAQTAAVMVSGVRKLLKADNAVAVTGLAGPGGDEFGHEVGTVFIGYENGRKTMVEEFHFSGDREAVRQQTVETALRMILENI